MIKILILVAVVIVVVRFVSQNNEKIQFFTTGMDKGFKISEIFALWKLAKVSNLENPESLYFSLPIMSDAISHLGNAGEQDRFPGEKQAVPYEAVRLQDEDKP